MATAVWPSSALSAADRAFTLLIRPPTTLLLQVRGVTGLPGGSLPLGELRELLQSPHTDAAARDQVWCELVRRSRNGGPAWVVAAVGVAVPALRRASARLSAGWFGDTDDLDAAMVAGFVAHLADVDLGASRVCGRLVDAGVYAAGQRRDAEVALNCIVAVCRGRSAPGGRGAVRVVASPPPAQFCRVAAGPLRVPAT